MWSSKTPVLSCRICFWSLNEWEHKESPKNTVIVHLWALPSTTLFSKLGSRQWFWGPYGGHEWTKVGMGLCQKTTASVPFYWVTGQRSLVHRNLACSSNDPVGAVIVNHHYLTMEGLKIAHKTEFLCLWILVTLFGLWRDV